MKTILVPMHRTAFQRTCYNMIKTCPKLCVGLVRLLEPEHGHPPLCSTGHVPCWCQSILLYSPQDMIQDASMVLFTFPCMAPLNQHLPCRTFNINQLVLMDIRKGARKGEN